MDHWIKAIVMLMKMTGFGAVSYLQKSTIR
jgi:hypothetical protein